MARRRANAFLLCWGAALYDWYRRISPIAARSGEDQLTERTPAVQPRRWERVKVPQRRRRRALPRDDKTVLQRSRREGGNRDRVRPRFPNARIRTRSAPRLKESVFPGPPDLLVGGGADPFERAHPTSVADAPVEYRPTESSDNCRRGLFYLIRIRVALTYNPLWQAMCGKQQPERSTRTPGFDRRRAAAGRAALPSRQPWSRCEASCARRSPGVNAWLANSARPRRLLGWKLTCAVPEQ